MFKRSLFGVRLRHFLQLGSAADSFEEGLKLLSFTRKMQQLPSTNQKQFCGGGVYGQRVEHHDVRVRTDKSDVGGTTLFLAQAYLID